MNGAQRLLERLLLHRVETLFGYPGGAILPLYDALRDVPLRHVLVRHEQAAAFAAEGYARASGRLGVAVATSGPGATNLVTGIANAAMDSIPLLVVTGQVSTALLGTSAFQEVDILGMTLGVCKHSRLVTDPADLHWMTDEAIELALSGRPGPVLLDVPKDVLMAPAPLRARPIPRALPRPAPETFPATAINQAASLLEHALRPLVMSGGGVAMADAVQPLRALVQDHRLPHITTLKGIGNADPDDDATLGMVGMYGSEAANEALQQCDVLLAVGVRFDDRATGRLDAFAPDAKIIHIDIDPAELHRIRRAEVAVQGSIAEVLPALGTALRGAPIPDARLAWNDACVASKAKHGWHIPHSDGPRWLASLAKHLPARARVACDVGNHQMWVARYMRFAEPRHHLSSAGLGAMGFGLPAAMGAQFADPDALVVLVSGDGSFMMNVQELETVRRERLPLKMLVIDNRALAMVGQQQRIFYGGESYCALDNPDFVALAEAFGIPAQRATGYDDPERTWPAFLRTQGPSLLVLELPADDEIWPLVPPGQPNHPMTQGPIR